jgi:hypothetical protein
MFRVCVSAYFLRFCFGSGASSIFLLGHANVSVKKPYRSCAQVSSKKPYRCLGFGIQVRCFDFGQKNIQIKQSDSSAP